MHSLQGFLLFHLLTCFGLHALGSEIINGKNVPVNSMLYMASVQNNERHICGGFLINEEFVVTAAHCSNPTSVVLGTHNLKKVDDNTMRYEIFKRCKFPSYVNVKDGDDIMLLKLSKKVRQNKRVKPIQLPKPESKINNKTKCLVAGWGYTRTGGEVVDVLQMVDVPIINMEDCKKEWGHLLPANVTCAGGYGKDGKGFCQGDSGGPLVCNNKAVGVVSFNLRKNCDYPNVPNVYTDISKYLKWIKNILNRKKC